MIDDTCPELLAKENATLRGQLSAANAEIDRLRGHVADLAHELGQMLSTVGNEEYFTLISDLLESVRESSES